MQAFEKGAALTAVVVASGGVVGCTPAGLVGQSISEVAETPLIPAGASATVPADLVGKKLDCRPSVGDAYEISFTETEVFLQGRVIEAMKVTSAKIEGLEGEGVASNVSFFLNGKFVQGMKTSAVYIGGGRSESVGYTTYECSGAICQIDYHDSVATFARTGGRRSRNFGSCSLS